ncbi:MAG TPA: hypothetical protein DHV15_01740 [Treponema sp.]|uniref:Uncharacterized protein n=1 Tax=Treponema denticola (strain ATCC 35405 / DSM 14222 / CIP 103919 / JCM 8153 / KCTC 15104) TaxID=243275 RepID=Q73JU1_TREDE|nr:hypothetical protein TDE_2494 [Treponema denticola ATCC 35405]HCY94225.1 hypothetical protein [Treponema sp.]
MSQPLLRDVDGREVPAASARIVRTGGKQQRQNCGRDERRNSCFAI